MAVGVSTLMTTDCPEGIVCRSDLVADVTENETDNAGPRCPEERYCEVPAEGDIESQRATDRDEDEDDADDHYDVGNELTYMFHIFHPLS